ncbi:hypothetical protein [Sphingobacterium faecium]|jgi:hypothetical protein
MDQNYDYIHELRNRQMALHAKIEASSIAGEIKFDYGKDYYQEEARCTGLRMIREGMNLEGENLILEYTKEYYPKYVEDEKKWIGKMMHDLNSITPTLIDNLIAEGYIALQSNVELPNDHALFYPIRELNVNSTRILFMDSDLLVNLIQSDSIDNLSGWVYYRSE